MNNRKKLIESYIQKIKGVLLKEEELDVVNGGEPKQDKAESSELSKMSMFSANKRADGLEAGLKIKANDILINALTKNGSYMPSSDFIDDMEIRYDWAGQRAEKMAGNSKAKLQRTETDSPKLKAFDYMLQVLSSVKFAPVGEQIQVGNNTIVVDEKVKSNAKDALMSATRLVGDSGKPTTLVKMLEGSHVYTVSDRKTLTKPPRNFETGAIDEDAYRDRLMRLQRILYSSLLERIFSRGGSNTATNMSSYLITSLRLKYIDLVRSDKSFSKGTKLKGGSSNVTVLPDGTKVIDDEYTDVNYSPNSSSELDDPESFGSSHASLDNMKGGHYRKYKGLSHGADADEPEQDPYDVSSGGEFDPSFDAQVNDTFDKAREQERMDDVSKMILATALEYVRNKWTEKHKIELIEALLNGDSISQIFRNPELGDKYPAILSYYDRDKTAMEAQNKAFIAAREEFKRAVEERKDEIPQAFLDKVRATKKNDPIRFRAVTDDKKKKDGEMDTSNKIPVEKKMKDGTTKTIYVDPDEYYAMYTEAENVGDITDILMEYFLNKLRKLNS